MSERFLKYFGLKNKGEGHKICYTILDPKMTIHRPNNFFRRSTDSARNVTTQKLNQRGISYWLQLKGLRSYLLIDLAILHLPESRESNNLVRVLEMKHIRWRCYSRIRQEPTRQTRDTPCPSLLQFNFDLLRLIIFIYSNFKSVPSFHVPILHHKHMNYSTPGIHCSRIKLS